MAESLRRRRAAGTHRGGVPGPAGRRATAVLRAAGALATVGALGGPAHAGYADLYGFGAQAQSRAGGGVAIVDDATATLLNPAALSLLDGPQLSIGYAASRARFKNLPAVQWDTNRDGLVDDRDPPLQPSSTPDRADGTIIAFGRPVGKRFGIAIVGWLPVDRLMRISTFEPSLPTWFMYENRPNRYELSAGFGWEQLPGVRLGGAVELIAAARYEINVTMGLPVEGSSEEGQELGELVGPVEMDVHGMDLDLVPAFAPVVGFRWDVGEVAPVLDGLSLAASWRGSVGLPVEVVVDLQANISLEEVGSLDPMTIALLAPIQLDLFDHYVPSRLAFGAAWQSPLWGAFVDVHRYAWDRMKVNVARVTSGRIESQVLRLSDPEFRDGNQFSLQLRPTWGTRLGVQGGPPPIPLRGAWEELTLEARASWGYEPTPLAGQGAESSLLDSDRMVFAGGLSLSHHDPFELVKGPLTVDLFGQIHTLAEGELDPGVGGDRPGLPEDGSAFPIGGRLWSLGGQWTVRF